MTIELSDDVTPHVRDKSRRLLRDQHVTFVKRFGDQYMLFWVLGDSLEVYDVVLRVRRAMGTKVDGNCPCEARALCSHLYAAYLHAMQHRLT